MSSCLEQKFIWIGNTKYFRLDIYNKNDITISGLFWSCWQHESACVRCTDKQYWFAKIYFFSSFISFDEEKMNEIYKRVSLYICWHVILHVIY